MQLQGAHCVRTNDEEGFRRLAKASLTKAIEDAAGRAEQTAYSAIRWLAGDTSAGLTFVRCCELIGVAPQTVRRSLRRRHEPIDSRLKVYESVHILPAHEPRDRFRA